MVSVFMLLDIVANRQEHLDFEMPENINVLFKVQIHRRIIITLYTSVIRQTFLGLSLLSKVKICKFE